MAIPEISAQTPTHDRRHYSAAVHAAFSGGLSLRTEEGDFVNLSFENEQGFAESQSQTRFADNETIQDFSSAAVAASRYSLTVQGDLNQEELDAIQRLVEEIGPIARGFFAQAEFDFAAVSDTLAGSLGVIQEIELELERVITTTFAFQEYTSQKPLEVSDLENAQNGKPLLEPIDPDPIRNLPELVLASIEAELEAQAAVAPNGETILRSLDDLMRFLREQLSQFLNPLDHSLQPSLKPLPQNIGIVKPAEKAVA